MESLRGSVAGSNALDDKFIEWPHTALCDSPLNYPAFDQYCHDSLCIDVEPVDLPPARLRERLATLTPGSGKAFWLVPFRGISASNVSSPIDLLFLDRNNCVLAMTESFPSSQVTSCNWPSGSALALPARTIAAREIFAGDKLTLGPPEKVKRRLQSLQEFFDDAQDQNVLSSVLSEPTAEVPVRHSATAEVIPWDNSRVKAHIEMPAPSAEPVSQTDQTAAEQPEATRLRVRIFRLLQRLWPKAKELRKSKRESHPWIAAYFPTEGAPVPSAVRNISVDGMYVCTGRHWQPGTVVRVTLTDWRLPSQEQAVVVNAMPVRRDENGVGFLFVFQKKGKQHRDAMPSIRELPLSDVTRKQIKDFMKHFSGRN